MRAVASERVALRGLRDIVTLLHSGCCLKVWCWILRMRLSGKKHLRRDLAYLLMQLVCNHRECRFDEESHLVGV